MAASFNHPGVFFGAVVTPDKPHQTDEPVTLTGVVLDATGRSAKAVTRSQLRVQVRVMSKPCADTLGGTPQQQRACECDGVFVRPSCGAVSAGTGPDTRIATAYVECVCVGPQLCKSLLKGAESETSFRLSLTPHANICRSVAIRQWRYARS